MISTPAIAALALTAVVSYGLYELKYKVQGLERHYTDLSRELLEEQDAVHVLKAEWSYLSRPYRVQKLANRFLPLQHTSPTQFAQFKDLPLRPALEGPLPSPRRRPIAATTDDLAVQP
jgi:hypothetical protein